jgi:hypothetical protein
MQTHLYRRGAIYYWRRLVPIAFQPILGSRDLRASLQTNLPETARSRARQMDAAFDLALEELEQIVRAGQVLPDAVKSRFVRELRQEIIDKADGRRLMAGDLEDRSQARDEQRGAAGPRVCLLWLTINIKKTKITTQGTAVTESDERTDLLILVQVPYGSSDQAPQTSRYSMQSELANS